MTNTQPLIEVTKLEKTYHMGDIAVRALRKVDLQFFKNEFTAIMGASGSGKSTLMHILGCLDKPTSGQYFIAGEDVSDFSKNKLAEVRNRRIGFVFQGFNLLPRTTALENVEMPMVYAGIKSKERYKRAMKALESVGLKGREHHLPNQLSGGQQQRVAIARALVNNPSVILADEPTGNLDSRSSVEIMEIFQQLNSKGISIIVITHEDDIARYTKRLVKLSDGKIVGDEPVENQLNASSILAKMPKVDIEIVKEQQQ